MRKKLYIDFDGTLYDTDKSVKNFLALFKSYGIEKEEVLQTEQELFNDNHLFDMDEVAKHLKEKHNLPKQFLAEAEELYTHPNLYSDVIPSLKRLEQSNKYEMYILTYGSIKYQQKKIQYTNISKYFKSIIITEDNKANLKEIDYQNGIFIDNNPKEIESLFKAQARNIFRIRNTNDKYAHLDSTMPVKEYSNLEVLIEEELL